jgi:ribosomal protein L37AE/L43A
MDERQMKGEAMSEKQRKTFLARPFSKNKCKNCTTEVVFPEKTLAYTCPCCGWAFESKTGWTKSQKAKRESMNEEIPQVKKGKEPAICKVFGWEIRPAWTPAGGNGWACCEKNAPAGTCIGIGKTKTDAINDALREAWNSFTPDQHVQIRAICGEKK